MYAHTSCEVAKELVILPIGHCDANTERGIGERFLNDADELYDIFRHSEQDWEDQKRTCARGSREILPGSAIVFQGFLPGSLGDSQSDIANIKKCFLNIIRYGASF